MAEDEIEITTNDTEVIEVVSGAVRRRRSWVVAAGAALLLVGSAVWATTAGSDDNSARSDLTGEESLADTATTESPDTATTVVDASVLLPDTTLEWGLPDDSSLGDDVLLPEPGTGGGTYEQFVLALQRNDSAFISSYCSSSPPEAWRMPNLVGRDSSRPLLSSGERADLVVSIGCEQPSAALMALNDTIIWSRQTACTNDPSLDGVVAAQANPPGSIPGYANPYSITVYRFCEEPTTTCVLVTSPPPVSWGEDVTTTVGWNCR